MWQGTEYEGNFYEHNYNDSDSDLDYSDSHDASKEMVVETALVDEIKMQDGHKSVCEHDSDEDTNVKRFPAILRVNRQIYTEVSSLLHTELCLTLQPGDVLCMSTGKDIVKASEKVWRHNPLHGIGTTDSNGQTIYTKPELNGVMEPHVFARFERICFDFDVSWEVETLEAEAGRTAAGDQTAPSLFVNDDLTVRPEDEAKLLAFYKRSTIVHQLVKILSNSPRIFCLQIFIAIEVLARYDMSSDMSSDSDFDEDDSEITVTDEKMDVANGRATELFLDSGILGTLEKLSNVLSFELHFRGLDRHCETYQPTSKNGTMLKDLKEKIERNYTGRDD